MSKHVMNAHKEALKHRLNKVALDTADVTGGAVINDSPTPLIDDADEDDILHPMGHVGLDQGQNSIHANPEKNLQTNVNPKLPKGKGLKDSAFTAAMKKNTMVPGSLKDKVKKNMMSK